MDRDGLTAEIRWHFPTLILGHHFTNWTELADGSPAVFVDSPSVMFTSVDDDLHVTAPVPGDKVACYVFPRYGGCYLAATATDSFSAAAAARTVHAGV